MSSESKLSRRLKWARSALKPAPVQRVRVIAALCALLLQYGCAMARQNVFVPAVQYPHAAVALATG